MSHAATKPTVAILTLGCKLNLADSEAMSRRMRDAGWSVVEKPAGADAIVVNTCSVTHAADRKSRHLVRLARKLAPGAPVALTGCMLATAEPPTIDALAADYVYRRPDQDTLVRRLIELGPVSPPSAATRPALRRRAFVSAQEGCDDVCAFCIVPRTRGRERSKPVDDVVAEVKAREAEGVQEVVITGTQLGAFGRDRGARGMYPLLSALLTRTGVSRIRMSSVQPQDLTPELVGLWRDPRLCRHFHLALQSGSESVLRAMRRRYSAAQYGWAVQLLRSRIDGVAITTDVIAGFPGETEAHFEETFAFCHEMGFAGMHVFPYSQRQGTVAAKMPMQVAEEIKRQRARRLIELGRKMAVSYRRRLLGSSLPVLWETRKTSPEGDLWEGLTDTYVRVRAPSAINLENRIRNAHLTAIDGDAVRGELQP